MPIKDMAHPSSKLVRFRHGRQQFTSMKLRLSSGETGQTVVFVRFKAGKLSCERLMETMFRETWHESQYPLPETIERFLEHARIHGLHPGAQRGLIRLQERDRAVVASLF